MNFKITNFRGWGVFKLLMFLHYRYSQLLIQFRFDLKQTSTSLSLTVTLSAVEGCFIFPVYRR